MIKAAGPGGLDFQRLQADLRALSDASTRSENPAATGKSSDAGSRFLEMLKEGIGEVNTAVKASEQASMDLVSGKSSNLHETMLAVSKAELGVNLIVQMRNKAIEAYQEVMRMQV